MNIKTNLPYPSDNYVELLTDVYADINGKNSFDQVKNWQSEKWSATVFCARGKVLEKGGFARVNLFGGLVNESPADISLFQTIAYPANPRVPGFIIMANMNSSEAMGNILTLYLDLIVQDGKSHDEAKKLFSDTLNSVCEKHGQDLEEHRAMLTGGRLLGGSAAECGLLNFFEEKDVPLLDDLVRTVLPVYKKIIEMKDLETPQKEDFEHMNKSRARLIEWIILEDYGTKVARENGVSSEVIEAYGFPPVIRY